MVALFSICYNLYRYYCYYYSAPIGFNRFLLLYIFARDLLLSSLSALPYQSLQRKRKRGRRSGRLVRSKYISKPIPVVSINHLIASNITFPAHLRPHCSRDSGNLRCIPRVPKNRMFKLGLWNARSVNNKVAYISEFIISNSLDILILTETWLSSGKAHTLGLFHDLLPGYTISNQPRHSHGGV